MYILKNLFLGDIILISSASKFGQAIKLFDGHFTHACMVVGETTVIEALTKSGVQITSLLRFCFKSKENVKVLRVNLQTIQEIENFYKKISEDINSYTTSYQSKSYDFNGAIFSKLPQIKSCQEDKFFCSNLIVEIYDRLGYNLFPQSTSKKITPNDFLKTNILQDVTENTVHLLEKNIEDKYKNNSLKINIDEGATTTSIDATMINNFMAEARRICKKHKMGNPTQLQEIIELIFPDLGNNITGYYSEADKELSKAFKNKFDYNKLRGHLKSNIDQDVIACESEIAEFGLEYGKSLLKNQKNFLECLKNKNEEKREFLELLQKFNSYFAKTLCEYYAFHINVGDQLVKDIEYLNCKIEKYIKK